MPVVGFTWYGLTDMTDWDVALRERRGTVNPVGLFDLVTSAINPDASTTALAGSTEADQFAAAHH